MTCGAKDEARTRDINLGKVALYQLSYFRKSQYYNDSKIIGKSQYLALRIFIISFLHNKLKKCLKYSIISNVRNYVQKILIKIKINTKNVIQM